MPLYEYNCPNCGNSFELLVTGNAAPAAQCPVCANVQVDRLIGLPARGQVLENQPTTNCRGDGPPCGAPWCRRKE